MTVDECVDVLEWFTPPECTDTYAFNGCPFLVNGKVDREAIEDLEAMDPSYVSMLIVVAKDHLVFNGWIKGEPTARTKLNTPRLA